MQSYILAGIVEYINDVKDASDVSPVFKMSDIADLYAKGMAELGFSQAKHSTRLKDRLLDMCPYLEASGKPGQDIILTFRNDVYYAVKSSCRNYVSDALEVSSVTKIIRKDMFEREQTNWEDTDEQKDFVP